MTTLLGMLNTKAIDITQSPVTATAFSTLLQLLEKGSINANAAKTVFEKMVATGKEPGVIVKAMGLEQVSDPSELEEIVNKIIQDNPDEAAAYRDGKTKLFSFFMGQVMKQTRGKADPKVVTPLIKAQLAKS